LRGEAQKRPPLDVTQNVDHQTTVIGAGIIGICCALELSRIGQAVHLVDRAGPAEGTSMGNAGVISPWSCVPQSLPGQWKRIPRWALSRDGPVALRWRYLPYLLPWIGRFLASAGESRIDGIADALFTLNEGSPDLYRAFLRGTGGESLIRDASYIHVFRNPEHAQPSSLQWRMRLARGVPLQFVSGDEVREIEPALSGEYRAAVLIQRQARSVNPGRLGKVLARAAQEQGVHFQNAEVTELVRSPDGIWEIRTPERVIRSARLVLAGGAWSARLLKPLGVFVPLESERGYHTVFANPGVTLSNSILDGDKKFAASSMEVGLRCAGTAEFAGLDTLPDYRRAKAIARLAKSMMPGLNISEFSEWMGSRPATPDSLPCIGPVPRQQGLFGAFGHGHLGLTQAPMTARIIAAMINGGSCPIDIRPYRLDRF